MIINRIEIEHFGKFDNYAMDFTDGLNKITGENEFGKTTILCFIVLMLYGDVKKVNGDKDYANPRKRYKPWNGSAMAGRMYFTHEGTEYELHITFGAGEKSDKITLKESTSGKNIDLEAGETVGKHFMGLDVNGFLSTAYIGDSGSSGFVGSDELLVRISRLSETGDENYSSADVKKHLDDAINGLHTPKNVGALDKLEEARRQAVATLSNTNMIISQQAELHEQIELIKNDIEEALRRKADIDAGYETLREGSVLKNYRMIADKAGEIAELKKEISPDTLKGQLEIYDRSLLNIKVKEEYASTLGENTDDDYIVIEKDTYNRYQKLIMERDKISGKLCDIETETDEEKRNACEPPKSSESGIATAATIFGLILLVAGIIIAVFFRQTLLIPGIIGSLIGIVLAVYGVLRTLKARSLYAKCLDDYDKYSERMKALERKRRENEENLKGIERELREIYDETGYRENNFDDAYSKGLTVAEARRNYSEAEAELKRLKNEFVAIVGATDYQEAVRKTGNMRKSLDHYDSAVSAYNSMVEASGLTEEEIFDRKAKLEAHFIRKGFDVNNIDEEFDKCRNSRAALENEIKLKQEQLVNASSRLTRPSVDAEILSREIEAMDKDIADMREYYDCLDIARKYLIEAVDEASGNFSTVLNAKSSAIFKDITCGMHDRLGVDREFGIGVTDGFSATHNAKGYSSGTAEQAYLALRLGMLSIISGTEDGEERPIPLLLDDAFALYSSDRREAAMKYIEKYARNGQVILFQHS